jgi:hypothetical protein
MQRACEEASTGHNELRQYERFLAALHSAPPESSTKSLPTAPAGALLECNYTVSELHEQDGRGCAGLMLRLNVQAKCGRPATSFLPLGGASLRVIARSESTLTLCNVVDLFDDSYQVWCVPPAPGGCIDVDVRLGFERFRAYYNPEPGGSSIGYYFGNATNGQRKPLMVQLAQRRWCAGSNDEHIRASATSQRPPPATWPRSVWMRTTTANATAPDWWRRHWHWEKRGGERQRATADSHGEPTRDPAFGPPLPPRDLTTSGLATVDFVGESHLSYVQDCLALELYSNRAAGVAHNGKGRFESQAGNGGSTVARGSADGSDSAWSHAADGAVAAARGGMQSIEPWVSCGLPTRALGCWPTYDLKVKNWLPKQTVGLTSFWRSCWAWFDPAHQKSCPKSAAAPPLRIPPARGVRSPPHVCMHNGVGLYRAAMSLRLMLADWQADDAPADVASTDHVPAGPAGGADAVPARPPTRRDVIVVQAGTWDTLAMPHLKHVLADLEEVLEAVRALRRAARTRAVRILLMNLPAVPTQHYKSGVSNSWAHAAVNAHLRRALAAEPQLHVELVDALAVSWPREDSSPDGIHYLRRVFRTPSWNNGRLTGLKVNDHFRPSFTPPPMCARCLGDVGWELADALHAQILADPDRADAVVNEHQSHKPARSQRAPT